VLAQPVRASRPAPPSDFQPTDPHHPLSVFILLMSLPLTLPVQLEAKETMTKSSAVENVGENWVKDGGFRNG